jgi:hypothetical protein
MLEVIEWNILRFKRTEFTKQLKELFLCYFNQNFNKNPNQLMLEEYWDIKDLLSERYEE